MARRARGAGDNRQAVATTGTPGPPAPTANLGSSAQALDVPPWKTHRDSQGVHRGVTGSFRAAPVAQPRRRPLTTQTPLGAHPPLGGAAGCEDPPSLTKRPLTVCVAGARGPCWPDPTGATRPVQEARASVSRVLGAQTQSGSGTRGPLCFCTDIGTWGRPPRHWPSAGPQPPWALTGLCPGLWLWSEHPSQLWSLVDPSPSLAQR